MAYRSGPGSQAQPEDIGAPVAYYIPPHARDRAAARQRMLRSYPANHPYIAQQTYQSTMGNYVDAEVRAASLPIPGPVSAPGGLLYDPAEDPANLAGYNPPRTPSLTQPSYSNATDSSLLTSTSTPALDILASAALGAMEPAKKKKKKKNNSRKKKKKSTKAAAPADNEQGVQAEDEAPADDSATERGDEVHTPLQPDAAIEAGSEVDETQDVKTRCSTTGDKIDGTSTAVGVAQTETNGKHKVGVDGTGTEVNPARTSDSTVDGDGVTVEVDKHPLKIGNTKVEADTTAATNGRDQGHTQKDTAKKTEVSTIAHEDISITSVANGMNRDAIRKKEKPDAGVKDIVGPVGTSKKVIAGKDNGSTVGITLHKKSGNSKSGNDEPSGSGPSAVKTGNLKAQVVDVDATPVGDSAHDDAGGFKIVTNKKRRNKANVSGRNTHKAGGNTKARGVAEDASSVKDKVGTKDGAYTVRGTTDTEPHGKEQTNKTEPAEARDKCTAHSAAAKDQTLTSKAENGAPTPGNGTRQQGKVQKKTNDPDSVRDKLSNGNINAEKVTTTSADSTPQNGALNTEKSNSVSQGDMQPKNGASHTNGNAFRKNESVPRVSVGSGGVINVGGPAATSKAQTKAMPVASKSSYASKKQKGKQSAAELPDFNAQVASNTASQSSAASDVNPLSSSKAGPSVGGKGRGKCKGKSKNVAIPDMSRALDKGKSTLSATRARQSTSSTQNVVLTPTNSALSQAVKRRASITTKSADLPAAEDGATRPTALKTNSDFQKAALRDGEVIGGLQKTLKKFIQASGLDPKDVNPIKEVREPIPETNGSTQAAPLTTTEPNFAPDTYSVVSERHDQSAINDSVTNSTATDQSVEAPANVSVRTGMESTTNGTSSCCEGGRKDTNGITAASSEGGIDDLTARVDNLAANDNQNGHGGVSISNGDGDTVLLEEQTNEDKVLAIQGESGDENAHVSTKNAGEAVVNAEQIGSAFGSDGTGTDVLTSRVAVDDVTVETGSDGKTNCDLEEVNLEVRGAGAIDEMSANRVTDQVNVDGGVSQVQDAQINDSETQTKVSIPIPTCTAEQLLDPSVTVQHPLVDTRPWSRKKCNPALRKYQISTVENPLYLHGDNGAKIKPGFSLDDLTLLEINTCKTWEESTGRIPQRDVPWTKADWQVKDEVPSSRPPRS